MLKLVRFCGGKASETTVFFLSSRKCGNQMVKRWDPMKSTLTKAQSIVNEEGYTGPALAADNSNYFEIVSANYLGQTQTTQFQSKDQFGVNWVWGSKCTAIGNCDLSNPENNELAEIPRSIQLEKVLYGSKLNWYAATAESGTYSMGYGLAKDSVCPKSWKLPSSSDTSTPSWRNLIINAEQYITTDGYNNAGGSSAVRKLPLSLAYSGSYGWSNGVNGFSDATFQTRQAANGHTNYILNVGNQYLWTSYSDNLARAHGFPVRCVLSTN